MKMLLILLTLLLTGGAVGAWAEEKPVPPLELRWHGKDVPLDAKAQRDLTGQAIRLEKSSNFHSGDVDSLPSYRGPEARAEIQHRYRAAVQGSYAVVNFPEPRKIQTVGGEITVAEVVIALNREDFADGLFTINETYGVVGHGKYLGVYCIEFLNAVKRYAAVAPN